MIRFEAPVRIESEMNRREHWGKRKRRFDGHRKAVYFCWPEHCAPHTAPPGAAFTVTLTRIGPRRLDTDNLASGFKAVRDEIARILGIDDGDDRLTWVYRQEKGKPKEYAIRVEIVPSAA